ncbi:sugar ABC transporter ATP-binding protein [Christensenella intestinihominis]|uniref:sugar ABC transporter ATP-binding protein n=1 Tax=Christensenella intestinihominis TaxID=1851429 RepID=UPI0008370A15|nr:sugar ABC transporter ATP-binding protein [Christensenella intestinihominis]
MDLLKIDHLSKYYSGVKALDDISFSVRKGEIHAICGENGAGKSTLIKVLTGAIHPTKGGFEFDGKAYDKMTPHQAMEAGIRAIYQEFTLIPYLSIAENLFYGHELMKGVVRDSEAMNRRTRELCEEIGVDLNPREKVEALGIAQQQIVEILKAVSQSAKLFIMDEPTAPLTLKETKIFFRIIEKLKAEGATIIYISHRLEEIFELSDSITVFCDGKYVVTKKTEELDKKQLIAYMVGRELGENYPRAAQRPGEEVLKVENLNGTRLHDVSFSLRKGEILGFGGLIGAGRTELARAIFGADKITGGKITLKGKEYKPKSPAAALRAGIGLIPEDRKNQGLIMEMSVKQNISIGVLDEVANKKPYLSKKRETEYSDQYIRELKIKTPADTQLVKNLSGGNQQKVVLAKMMAINCDILIFDEPTRGIDVGAKQEIYTLMRALADDGKAIIMISSEMPELIGMSDRIAVMSNGYHVAELGREEFSQEKILEYASSKLVLEGNNNDK